MQAYEYIQRMRADMRGTNLQGALSWLYQQPMQRSYPRQVFIITDGSISNVSKVLELVRRNTCAGRYVNHVSTWKEKQWRNEGLCQNSLLTTGEMEEISWIFKRETQI